MRYYSARAEISGARIKKIQNLPKKSGVLPRNSTVSLSPPGVMPERSARRVIRHLTLWVVPWASLKISNRRVFRNLLTHQKTVEKNGRLPSFYARFKKRASYLSHIRSDFETGKRCWHEDSRHELLTSKINSCVDVIAKTKKTAYN